MNITFLDRGRPLLQSSQNKLTGLRDAYNTGATCVDRASLAGVGHGGYITDRQSTYENRKLVGD